MESVNCLIPDSVQKTTESEPGSEPAWCHKHGQNMTVEEHKILGGLRRISSCAACDDESRAQAAKAERHVAIQRLRDRANIPSRYADASLDKFWVTTRGEREVLEAAQKFVESAGAENSGLLLLGKVGAGKTFLACAVLNAFLARERSGLYLTAMQCTRRIKASWSKSSQEDEQGVFSALAKPALLVVDEIGVQFGTDAERLIISEVISDRYNAVKPTVLISNLTIAEFTNVAGDRVVDRFKEGGKVLVFDWPSRRPEAGKSNNGAN